jgi:hypothetical protein
MLIKCVFIISRLKRTKPLYFLVFFGSVRRLLVAACVVPSSPIFGHPDEGGAPKRRFLQEPHGVTTQKTPFFIVTAVKTSNLINLLS